MRLPVLIAGLLLGLMLSTDVIAQPPQQRTAADFISRLRSLDANKDGKIAKDELPERMQSILTRVDTNKDDFIDEQELKTLEDRFKGNAAQRPQGNGQPADRPQGQRPQGRASGQPTPQAQQGQQRTVGGFIARLREMDANQDGKISKDELPERMRSILTRVDTNNDDSIDEKELEALAKRFSNNAGERPQGDGQQTGRPQGQRPPGFGGQGGQGGRPGQGGQPGQPGGRPNGFGANNPQGQRPPGFGGQGGQGGRPGQGGQPGQPGGANALPPLPIFMVLDRDRNGELSREEVANAAKALSQLDRDRNGKLTIEELMPAGFGRGGRPGQGGAGAAGGQGGRPGQGGQPGQPGGFGGQGGRPGQGGQPGQPGGGRGTQRPQRPE